MANFKPILDEIDNAISSFIERIPASQTDMLDALDEELRKLDLQNGNIKPTIKNLNIVTNIKNKLMKVILTDAYKSQVKAFLNSFNEITKLQNQYWRSIETSFKPSSILKEIKKIAIEDTAAKLMETGLEASVAQPIKDILTTNITQGGSYKDLQAQLKNALGGNAPEVPGILDRHTKQVTVDATNQYNRNYTQIASSDLGFEWYAYQNTLINTSRPFCISMHERRYFHVSQIPDLLEAKDMYYTKKNKDGTTERRKVELDPKTKLPRGMYPNTNVSNFLTLLGGYNCGHQPGPVSANLVKMQNPKLYNEIINSSNYKRWKERSKK
jgi:hypothetical protein